MTLLGSESDVLRDSSRESISGTTIGILAFPFESVAMAAGCRSGDRGGPRPPRPLGTGPSWTFPLVETRPQAGLQGRAP